MNTSDFIGFGAGVALGGVMAREIGNAFVNGIDTHANMNVMTVPQTRGEIQTLLDKLDVRLVNGEITEEIFKTLTEKWSKRMNEIQS